MSFDSKNQSNYLEIKKSSSSKLYCRYRIKFILLFLFFSIKIVVYHSNTSLFIQSPRILNNIFPRFLL